MDVQAIEHDFERFVRHLREEKGRPHQPYQDWVEPVPETIVWLVKDEEYIGTIDIRHRLNWHLEKWGGHVNFVIRPSMRRKGYGRKILQKSIPIINYIGIEKALLTVKPDNVAGIKIVESCGGVFEDETPETETFAARRRYWLDCS
jgi:predicted acetyltransferase